MELEESNQIHKDENVEKSVMRLCTPEEAAKIIENCNMLEKRRIIPRSNTYDKIFSSVVYIGRYFGNHCIEYGCLDDFNVQTNFDSSKRMIEIMVKLVSELKGGSVAKFIFELEFNKLVRHVSSEEELFELVLSRQLSEYILEGKPDDIYDLIIYLGDDVLRDKLVPHPNWREQPV